jgi:putative transposase
MCKHLQVSKSGYYEWCSRPPSQRSINDRIMTERIRKIHVMSDYTYGRARVQAELGDMSLCVNHKRIERLMKQANLQGVSRRRGYVVTTQRDRHAKAAPDLVKRQFTATGINQLWVADMTYVPTWAGFLYLAVVVDVYSRKVVGWAFGERMTSELVIAALNMALHTRRPESVIHHSDQGSQGGFNRSSQHLQPGDLYGATRRMDEAFDRERRHALSGSSCASARGRAPVLGTDCNGDHK